MESRQRSEVLELPHLRDWVPGKGDGSEVHEPVNSGERSQRVALHPQLAEIPEGLQALDPGEGVAAEPKPLEATAAGEALDLDDLVVGYKQLAEGREFPKALRVR